MSENQNNETLCDFIGEIRSQADEIAKHLGDQHTFVEQKKQLADRLDQIRMRMEIEQAKLRGNSAAMREALKRIVAASIVAKNANAPEWILQRMADIFAMATTALNAPPRNCDRFATVDEAIGAYRQTHKYMVVNVFLDWLFAQATEKEGGAK